jgi:hypothetical protein
MGVYVVKLPAPARGFGRRRNPKRVQHGHCPIKLLLGSGSTGHGKVHLAQLFGLSRFLLSRQHGCGPKYREDQE